jgi:hypothetical protein
MSKMLGLFGAIMGGWLGWRLGLLLGSLPAYFLGVVGMAAGLYLARRFTRAHLG